MRSGIIFNYKISGLGQFPNYKISDRPFHEHTFVYAVSVGSDHFENDWVSGYMNFAKSVGLRRMCVVVADTLQRHNLPFCDDTALEVARQKGQDWVRRYRADFDTLGNAVEFEFVHWDEFLEHENFPKYLEFMKNLEASDPDFKASLEETVSDFVWRTAQRSPDAADDLEDRARRSADYFIEEFAAIWIMAQNPNLKGILYPCKAPKAFAYMVEYINKEIRKDDPFLWLELQPKRKRNVEREMAGA